MTTTDLLSAMLVGAFIVPLVGGALTTAARVLWYARHRELRPRLLTRDVIVIGGLALAVLLVFAARIARAAGMDTSGLIGNPAWILATSIPVLAAIWVYFLYELLVIERGNDAPYSEREHGEVDE